MIYKNTQLLQLRKSFMIPSVNFIEIHFSVSFLDGLTIANYFPVYNHPVLFGYIQLNFIALSRCRLLSCEELGRFQCKFFVYLFWLAIFEKNIYK